MSGARGCFVVDGDYGENVNDIAARVQEFRASDLRSSDGIRAAMELYNHVTQLLYRSARSCCARRLTWQALDVLRMSHQYCGPGSYFLALDKLVNLGRLDRSAGRVGRSIDVFRAVGLAVTGRMPRLLGHWADFASSGAALDSVWPGWRTYWWTTAVRELAVTARRERAAGADVVSALEDLRVPDPEAPRSVLLSALADGLLAGGRVAEARRHEAEYSAIVGREHTPDDQIRRVELARDNRDRVNEVDRLAATAARDGAAAPQALRVANALQIWGYHEQAESWLSVTLAGLVAEPRERLIGLYLISALENAARLGRGEHAEVGAAGLRTFLEASGYVELRVDGLAALARHQTSTNNLREAQEFRTAAAVWQAYAARQECKPGCSDGGDRAAAGVDGAMLEVPDAVDELLDSAAQLSVIGAGVVDRGGEPQFSQQDSRRPPTITGTEEIEAVTEIFSTRELAAGNRDAHLPDLAMSVNNLAIDLAEAGRRAEGLAAAPEAATHYHELAQDDPSRYGPDAERADALVAYLRENEP